MIIEGVLMNECKMQKRNSLDLLSQYGQLEVDPGTSVTTTWQAECQS